jgi:hypothetical protein
MNPDSSDQISREEGKSVSLGDIDVIYKIRGTKTNGRLAVVEHPIEPKRLVRPMSTKMRTKYRTLLRVRIGGKEIIAKECD